MKSKLLSLAALLMAGAATQAFAQDQPIQNGGPMYNAAQQAKARQAQAQAHQGQAAQAPANGAPGAPGQAHPPQQRGGERPPQAGQPPQAQPAQRPPQPPQPQNGRPQPGTPGGPSYRGGPGDHRGGAPQGGDRQNWDGRGPGPDRQSPERPNSERPNPDRHDGGRYDGDRRDGDRWDGNRPGDGRRPDWDRDHGRGPPRDGPQWAPRRYPPIYSSPSRYRGPYWRPPEGFYVRAWRYGEFLPRAWYGPDYQLMDWWSYGLPEPPYGYDWVRVGPDALLVDYSGRIVQVVRAVFW